MSEYEAFAGLNESLESLSKTALRIKEQRDELLAACEAGFNALQEECFLVAARRPGAVYETPAAKVLDQMEAAIKKARGA